MLLIYFLAIAACAAFMSYGHFAAGLLMMAIAGIISLLAFIVRTSRSIREMGEALDGQRAVENPDEVLVALRALGLPLRPASEADIQNARKAIMRASPDDALTLQAARAAAATLMRAREGGWPGILESSSSERISA